ncbi:hypothetical protein [Amycolatopsis vastitatis]|uniref:Uncharacterized protein n=1 Tax=Amycolatopsis vastitatis TaxID=1905142 RepID=A0A229SYB1_9PSEU|nr:hypothetical protein [Amycolatopsis vastitatis]OXM64055.1 hypothetical protein CF165_27290 [Amycolatopsis vastitatis]
MHFANEEHQGPRRVKVLDREDVGFVVDEGKSFGSGNAHVYCVGVHFPDTGEVKFYDKSKVTTV